MLIEEKKNLVRFVKYLHSIPRRNRFIFNEYLSETVYIKEQNLLFHRNGKELISEKSENNRYSSLHLFEIKEFFWKKINDINLS